MNYIQKVRTNLAARINVEGDLLDLYTLLVLTKGAATTWEDVHNAWAVWRNRTNSTHKSLIPFNELTLEVQELDSEYAEAIIECWQSLNNVGPSKGDAK